MSDLFRVYTVWSLVDLVEMSLDDRRISSELVYATAPVLPHHLCSYSPISYSMVFLFCHLCVRSCINSHYQSVIALKSSFLNYDAKGCSKKKKGRGRVSENKDVNVWFHKLNRYIIKVLCNCQVKCSKIMINNFWNKTLKNNNKNPRR